MDSYAFERWECERTQYNFIHGDGYDDGAGMRADSIFQHKL